MIRLAWRQLRAQATVAGIGLAVVAVLLALTGPHLVHLYDTTVADCATHGDCTAATRALLGTDRFVQSALNVLVIIVPALLGMFWGAPLVAREFESGTFRLVWTQSVTRTRWLTARIGLAGLAAMAVGGLLSLMATWWFGPLDQVQADRLSSSIVFSTRDITPLGYSAFAFALGVTAGVVLRRTLTAMATTLVGFTFVRIAVGTWLRPRLISPLHFDFALNPNTTGYGFSGSLLSNSGPDTLQPNTPNIPGAWFYSTRIVDRAGNTLTSAVVRADCPSVGAGGGGPSSGGHGPVPAAVQQALHDCVAKVAATYHGVATFQPGDRYWTFQAYETAIFVGAAVLLAGFCLWWVHRRAT